MLNIETDKSSSFISAALEYLSLCPIQNILHPGSSESSVKKRVDVDAGGNLCGFDVAASRKKNLTSPRHWPVRGCQWDPVWRSDLSVWVRCWRAERFSPSAQQPWAPQGKWRDILQVIKTGTKCREIHSFAFHFYKIRSIIADLADREP